LHRPDRGVDLRLTDDQGGVIRAVHASWIEDNDHGGAHRQGSDERGTRLVQVLVEVQSDDRSGGRPEGEIEDRVRHPAPSFRAKWEGSGPWEAYGPVRMISSTWTRRRRRPLLPPPNR
jgi:hypothetical protein